MGPQQHHPIRTTCWRSLVTVRPDRCISQRTLITTWCKTAISSISIQAPPPELVSPQTSLHPARKGRSWNRIAAHPRYGKGWACSLRPAASDLAMDITKFVVSGRAQTFGDNAAYRAQLSKRLLKCRRRLGIATKPRAKFQARNDVTPEQIKEQPGYASAAPIPLTLALTVC